MLEAQPSLLELSSPAGTGEQPRPDRAFGGHVRTELGRGAWLDVVPGWVAGADELLDRVLAAAPWSGHERWMYDRVVSEPRLSTRVWTDPPDPVPEMAARLTDRYALDLTAVSANLYRDGRDSVAWHGDTAGRRVETTVVAIAVLGAPRRFLLRPRGGGPARRLSPGHGDLLVMGGTCQRTWEHAVPSVRWPGYGSR